MDKNDFSRVDEARWKALCDRRPVSGFVYAVLTTGVYCRSGCASRRPNRANVVFYGSYELAERAGFRPCKRCSPNVEGGGEEESRRRILSICRSLEQSEDSATLAELAKRARLSPFHFHRLFRRITGVTPREYQSIHRERRLRENLRSGTSVTRAFYDAGYSSSSRFYSSCDLGMPPAVFGRGGTGELIVYATGAASIGCVLVAGTKRGICAVSFGRSERELIRELQDDFPEAQIRPGDAGFRRVMKRVISSVEQPGTFGALPLDVRGTVFQLLVWKALRRIPAGETRSYGAIAAAMGRPKAHRAVASACAANRIAVLVPCHRVVRSDGSAEGYRWGDARKKELLRRECPRALSEKSGKARPRSLSNS